MAALRTGREYILPVGLFPTDLSETALCAKIIQTVSVQAVTRFLHLVPNEVFIKATFPQPFLLNMYKLKFRC